MADRDRCTSCGAAVPAETGVCAYCGTATAHDANVPPPARDRASEKIERFDRLAEHADFDKWMRWRPAQRPSVAALSPLFRARMILVVVGVVVLGFMFAKAGGGGALFVVPLVFLGLGVRLFLRAGDVAAPFDATAPAKAYPALVVAKRIDVTTGDSGRTSYFVTMEFRSGTRREYDVDGAFYGLVADDDIGVAYIREGDLLHFKKIDV